MITKKDNKKRMLVNAIHPEECRVAIVDGDELENIYIATASRQQSKGNIYKGVVVRVEPGLQAAFVEFDKSQKNGFLQFREICSDYHKPKGGSAADKSGTNTDKIETTADKSSAAAPRLKIQDVISKKQEMLIQVDSDARDLKGASLTTNISLAGRYMVMMPGQERLGISRRIENAKDRDKIRKIFSKLGPPKDAGFIVRTSGLDQSEATLKADLDYLVGRWEEIKKKSEKAKAPCLIHQEEDIIIRAIRDHLTDDVDEILIDKREISARVKEYFKVHIPKYQKRVKLYRDKRPLFFKFGVEKKLELIHNRQVPLPSGGSIVIDTAEALTAVDVNSGKTRGEKDIEDLALKTNLEALQEIARHLRLRDLGGLIVIDFIDMRPAKNRKAVEEKLREALKKDKAKIDISRISKFGLLEMSRERLRPRFQDYNYVSCPVCEGIGRYRTPEFLALTVLRELQEILLEPEANLLGASARLPVDAANYLLNNKRQELMDLEKRAGKPVLVVAAGDVSAGDYKLIVEREGHQTEEKDTSTAKKEDAAPKKKRKRRPKKKHRHEAVGNVETKENKQTNKEEKEEKEGKEEKSNETKTEGIENSDKQQPAPAPEKRKRRRPRRKPKPIEQEHKEPEATKEAETT